MERLVLFLALLTTLVECSPIPGSLNAEAIDQGNSTVIIDKDVILTSGKEGSNFNAKSESNGHAIVKVGGKVRGSIANRDGPEFNAKSKDGGTSQVLIAGDLELEGLHPASQKFDAISESGGQSLVQVGNMQVVSGARHNRKVRIHKKKPDRDDLGDAWGAVAVAEHNSRPWEDLEDEVNGDHIHVSDIFDDDHANDTPSDQFHPIGTEIHEFPHSGHNNITQVEVGVVTNDATTHTPILFVPSDDHGNLNAVSHGLGSTSVVKVEGSVQI